MKKRNILSLAFASISFAVSDSQLVKRPSKSVEGNTTNLLNEKPTNYIVKNNKKGSLNELNHLTKLDGVKPKRSYKHKFISKKHVNNMRKEDIYYAIINELKEGEKLKRQITSKLGILTQIDEEMKHTLAQTQPFYNSCKKNVKENNKILEYKKATLDQKRQAEAELELVRKHEETFKQANDKRRRFAEILAGDKKNYKQVKSNLKALKKRADESQRASIEKFLSKSPEDEAKEKLMMIKRAQQAKKAAIQQVKNNRRIENLNQKHGGEDGRKAYISGMQAFINEKQKIGQQMKGYVNNAVNKVVTQYKQSSEFKNLVPNERNQKLAQIVKTVRLKAMQEPEYINMKKSMIELQSKIKAYQLGNNSGK